MYINFQQNRVCKSVKTVHTNLFAKIAGCINLQLQIVFFKKTIISDMCDRKTYIYINFFWQTLVSRSIKIVHTNFLQKMTSCINLQLPIVILKKSILLDMHHRKTYMYINFQQNQVNRSVISVHTNLFAEIASCINLQLLIVILKKSILLDMHHHKTYMHINFQQNQVGRSVKTVHTNLFAKKMQIA